MSTPGPRVLCLVLLEKRDLSSGLAYLPQVRDKIKTTIYRKPTHTDRLLDQSLYNPTSHKATTILLQLSPFFASMFPLFPQKRLILRLLSMLYVRLTIKVKVGIPESFKVGWYLHKIIGSSHLKSDKRLNKRIK